jgi:outer membrane protein OmpA-like peptidoglycan-associated protein
MNRVRIYLLPLFLSVSLLSLAQTSPSKEFIRSVQEADMYFYYYEDFLKSAELYENIWRENKGNHNIAAKLAISLLNAEYRKNEAIPLLQFASGNIATNDSEYVEYGETAQVETLLYLAYAYHVNDSLSKALELYTSLYEEAKRTKSSRIEYIAIQMEACRLAIELRENPVKLKTALFAPFLKDYPEALNPALSSNDSVLVFNIPAGDGLKVLCSFKNSEWEKPVDITAQLGGFKDMMPNSITADGKFLVLYFFNGTDGSLFYSRRTGKSWSKIKKFPKPINTKYWENHGFITPDGKQLYFSSNREGGQGELDIYHSQLTADGDWSEPVNLGRTINTRFNETTPFYDSANKTLLFSSEGHRGIGGYDYFISQNINNSWNKPEHLPYPLNTTANNLFIVPLPEKATYLISAQGNDSQGKTLYRIGIVAGGPAAQLYITGKVTTSDGSPVNHDGLNISLFNRSNPDNKAVQVVPGEEMIFRIPVEPGDYILRSSYPGYNTDSVFITVAKEQQSENIIHDIILLAEAVSSGEFLTIRSILFNFDSYTLTDDAMAELDRLAESISGKRDLNLEVTGYTDSKGSTGYNKILAEKRANSVTDYLRTKLLSGVTIKPRAAGATGFVAINQNADGTDNPVGRGYNRRVTIGIVNPGTGVSVTPGIFIPKHLRHPQSEKFCVVLMESDESLSPDYFKSITYTGIHFIKPVRTDNNYLYILGDFPDRQSASDFLAAAVRAGFSDSYITSLYDLFDDEPESLVEMTSSIRMQTLPTYTVQLFAGKKMKETSFFGKTEFRVVQGKDGLFRYITGEFQSYSEARKALELLRSEGFHDSYIRDLRTLMENAVSPTGKQQ